MQTSSAGIATLVAEEGEVLRAYRCPAGKWTIGVGLTGNSGVIKPHAGMVITREKSRRLLSLSLSRAYEPTVEITMAKLSGSTSGSTVVRPAQHEFDAGVLFHFNSGAIGRASWVKLWKAGAAPAAIRAALGLWNRGGGRVLPGLVKRRDREADILLLGKYPVKVRETVVDGWATWGLALSPEEKSAARAALAKLGYAVGDRPGWVLQPAAVRFQQDHGLTPDGIIGRATLSTLQRRIDAVSKSTPAAAATPAATYVTTTGAADQALPAWVDTAVLAVLLIWLAVLAYRYRDVIAVKVQRVFPSLANLLRSF
ncbi:lysozyme [Pseudogemmobacter blasticus]|uniref:Lysozyme n=1 Tax=Fuscovulum blasticum DSM 2131 TaxID=1188250 RepID=A0A2T4JDG6_FUSBL|nr:peptidoglycan-binding protein [Fuscovulum blasticum]PTE15949.1 lysozyme [Fuscovulum blasticum DSM 2131]